MTSFSLEYNPIPSFISRSLVLALCFFLLLFPFSLSGQANSDDQTLNQSLKKAESFMRSFKNDSANIILSEMLEVLKSEEKLSSAFGLKIQLLQAEVLEKDHQNEIAIEKLLYLIDISKEKNLWSVMTNAHLSLARLHEKLGRKTRCHTHLLEDEKKIRTHQIDSLYPRFAIRKSSYHRLFSDPDSAKFYAMEVLRTAPELQQYEHEAVGHMLMGMLEAYSSYEKSASHYQTAGQRWLQVEDYSGYGAIMGNLSSLHLRNNNPTLALMYNDSSLAAAKMSTKMGNEQGWIYYTNYKKRASIYQAIGQQDSAWFYINKGYQMELDDVYQKNNAKVIEIDARYNDEKKAKTILDQQKQIQSEKTRRYWLSGIIFLFLLLSSLMTYYYLRLRKANRKTEAQAVLIKKTNDDLSIALQQQKVLQGEVHHRVKNNLQVIISLLELQMEEVDDPRVNKSFTSMANRVYSMAAIHEILYQQEDTVNVNFQDYIENLCLHFSNFSDAHRKPKFQLDLNNQHFNLETSMPLGIIITELLTNSLKHARVPDQQLQIYIGMKRLAEGLMIDYRDNGPGFGKGELEEREGGLGTYLLKSMTRQLSGRMESRNEDGAVFQIFFKEKNN